MSTVSHIILFYIIVRTSRICCNRLHQKRFSFNITVLHFVFFSIKSKSVGNLVHGPFQNIIAGYAKVKKCTCVL